MMAGLGSLLGRQPALYRSARRLRVMLFGPGEREMAMLPLFVDPRRLSVDVGANNGAYTQALLALGGRVVAVEANEVLARQLQRIYGRMARVICAAASSEPGTARLRIPRHCAGFGHGLATFEAGNTLDGAEVEEILVRRIPLDGMGLPAVGFIKIYVEGHELDVLMGAEAVLRRDRPTLLIESEERHRPGAVASVRDFLGRLGYTGFMIDEGRLASIAGFDPRRDQHVPRNRLGDLNAGHYEGRYINNFFFVA